jgi:hypothetical protein
MVKLWSTMIGTMFMVSAIAQTTEGWSEVPEAFKYESSGFLCNIKPDGSIQNLKIGDTLVVKQSLLFGKYKVIKEEKHDQRFFQSHKKKSLLLKVKSVGKNSFLVKKTGTLSNKKYKPAANYIEKIAFSPNKIAFEYEIETLVPLASKSSIFCSLTYLPLETFVNKGFKVTMLDNKEKLMVFPQKYSDASKLHLTAKDIKISLEKGIFEIAAGEGSSFSLSDTRSYKGDKFRIDLKEEITWRSKPVVFPAGKKFKWSFTLLFLKKEEKDD